MGLILVIYRFGIWMLNSQLLLIDRKRTCKVGDRILIAQALDPPLPNCTCSLSPHTALTKSPTLFTVVGASTSVRSYDSSKSTSHGWSRFPRTLPVPRDGTMIPP